MRRSPGEVRSEDPWELAVTVACEDETRVVPDDEANVVGIENEAQNIGI